jgi:hypothetical protein
VASVPFLRERGRILPRGLQTFNMAKIDAKVRLHQLKRSSKTAEIQAYFTSTVDEMILCYLLMNKIKKKKTYVA